MGLGPLSRGTTPDQAAAHDAQTAELARYKLGRLTRDDQDGYHRVACRASPGTKSQTCHPQARPRSRSRWPAVQLRVQVAARSTCLQPSLRG
jgi:hypothetical protein